MAAVLAHELLHLVGARHDCCLGSECKVAAVVAGLVVPCPGQPSWEFLTGTSYARPNLCMPAGDGGVKGDNENTDGLDATSISYLMHPVVAYATGDSSNTTAGNGSSALLGLSQCSVDDVAAFVRTVSAADPEGASLFASIRTCLPCVTF